MGHDSLLLGVDAGGTSTRVVVSRADGECVGYGVGGRGNPISAGVEAAAANVLDAARQALAGASSQLSDVTVITAAMAGQGSAERGSEWLLGPLREAGFHGALTFESDLLATFASGTAKERGYAVVAGTGASAVRVVAGIVEAVSDGLGWLLGDRGSGFWIGHQVARAVVRDLDRSGPSTSMTSAVLDRFGIVPGAAGTGARNPELEALIAALYAARPIELAALAPIAFDAPDRVATGILRSAGVHLADTLTAVLDGAGPLVLGGSVLSNPTPVREAFLERLGSAAASLQVVSVADGAVGAAVLALRAGGVPVSPDVFARINESLARLR